MVEPGRLKIYENGEWRYVTTGPSGCSGYSGWSGFSGTNGTTGTSGYSGWSGISGTNGTNGASGYSGWSGKSGYSGAPGTTLLSGISVDANKDWNGKTITNVGGITTTGNLTMSNAYVVIDKDKGIVGDGLNTGARNYIYGVTATNPDYGMSYYEGTPDYIAFHPNGTPATPACTINGAGLVTATKFHASSNGASDNIRVGDDAFIGDCNTANMISICGYTSGAPNANGGIVFGTGKDTNLYRSGANILKTDDAFQAASYAVGSTSVIDSSRNLTNIGTVGCGAITSSSTIKPRGGTIETAILPTSFNATGLSASAAANTSNSSTRTPSTGYVGFMPIYASCTASITAETNPGQVAIRVYYDNGTYTNIATRTTSGNLTATTEDFINAMGTKNGRYITAITLNVSGGETKAASVSSGIIRAYQF